MNMNFDMEPISDINDVTYIPLKIKTLEIAGLTPTLKAMRLPKNKSKSDSIFVNGYTNFKTEILSHAGDKDMELASKLIEAGDEHAKCIRGIDVWFEFEFQVGWMIELETYRIGLDTLSTTSSMHNELKTLKDNNLIIQKQKELPYKIYKRISKTNYQTLRRIYKQRRNHRHNDWQIFCDWIESLPFSNELITI